MTPTFILSSSNIQLHSTPFPIFPTTSKLHILKTPKPLKKAHTFFFTTTKNHYDNSENNQNNKNNYDENNTNIKMPTAPWMKAPLLLPSDEVIDLSNPNQTKKKASHKADNSLTEKVSGRRGKKVISKIVRKIERLQLDTDLGDTQKNWKDTQKNWDDTQKNWSNTQKNWKDTQKNWDDTQKNWGDTQKNWGDFRGGFLIGNEGESKLRRKMPWEKEQTVVFRRMKKEKVVTAAELKLNEELLKRLRKEGSKMRKWVKVKKAGVTQSVVDEVHKIWANNELVMLNFDLPLCRNMDRAREIVEYKTGGLVVLSKKDFLVAYRGCDYHLRKWSQKPYIRPKGEEQMSGFTTSDQSDMKFTSNLSSETGYMDREKDSLSSGLLMDRNLGIKPTDRSLLEREADRLLDGLGPRFVDWWYPKPLPVDGDLLPEVVPGFKTPFRLCLPRFRPKLTDDELTYLRKLARPLPVHFVLGRNSKLQGLAVAILKLWEKSLFAKVAVKWGVQNTSNELMASELKRLTGGILLLRNKFFIVLYRGKDFLPGNVADAVVERETELQQWQIHEEDARLKAAGFLDFNNEAISDGNSIIGTISEFQHIQSICKDAQQNNDEAELKIEAEKQRLGKELRIQEHKLAILKIKIEKAEKELRKLYSAWNPSEEEPDRELITEEERECFRSIGLKMNGVLELGRRGVFDGVIEGLHQHWKHREVVKVISWQKTFMQVVYTARTLERESGGILICIEKVKKGHAIIIYRGKNYRRPVGLGANLLDKKKALKLSLEKQRIGSLNFFAYQRDKRIAELKLQMVDLEKRRSGAS